MSATRCNNKGLSMLEVVIATMIVMIGVLGIMVIFPQGWKLSRQADVVGRAALILRDQLETAELQIMNCAAAVPTSSTYIVYASGGSTPQLSGDLAYTVTRSVTQSSTNLWLVSVRITCPGAGICAQDSILASKQDSYKPGAWSSCSH